MMRILVGLFLILIDPGGMEEVDERFLLLIQSLREVVQGVS